MRQAELRSPGLLGLHTLLESEPTSSFDRRAAEYLDKMVSALVADGNIVDPRWEAAFRAVPRHLFVPRFYRNDQEGSSIVDLASGDQWISAVYSDIHLVTTEDVRSSSTAPSLMAGHAPSTRAGRR